MKPQDRTRAILESRLDIESRMILVVLADHMGRDGVAWPSAERLAKPGRVTVASAARVGYGVGMEACDSASFSLSRALNAHQPAGPGCVPVTT
jgi:hypothetical protein